MSVNRRDFLRGVAGTFGAVVAGSLLGKHILADSSTLPTPAESGIEHIVVVMVENRSFDHILGWLPGADGRQAGLKYPDSSGALQSTYELAPDFTGCAYPDP